MFYQGKRNIILVEDNLFDIKIIKDALEKSTENYNIIVFKDGKTASEYFENSDAFLAENPHLVLLDLTVPNISGKELLKHLKENDKTKKIPVVVLSLSNYSNDICESYKNYANCYITKPKDIDDFINKINIITNYWFNIVKLPKAIELY